MCIFRNCCFINSHVQNGVFRCQCFLLLIFLNWFYLMHPRITYGSDYRYIFLKNKEIIFILLLYYIILLYRICNIKNWAPEKEKSTIIATKFCRLVRKWYGITFHMGYWRKEEIGKLLSTFPIFISHSTYIHVQKNNALANSYNSLEKHLDDIQSWNTLDVSEKLE